ncbi:ABC transporter permease [Paenibacillus baekrokdamisoli]|uniref:ABC transporter permease n=1 Tax=Paenibacillus baekrokdamisoli TaxID=1712516 RepID=A0A3G9IVH2_9BACL|nr:ABC transporter permease subunit [Paenibacillus baekrokdamisoli]MBB3068146.1 putative spermidine/putrescine transport system permease protein [Paenibacillus baekrokdamisoli]BBH22810.1 ABC transporter permease [Paenibacillus baekrokdamisoli]
MKQKRSVPLKQRGRRFRFRFIVLALVPFALIVIGFELLPLFYMIMTSLLSDDETHYSLSQYVTALTSPFYMKAIQNSLYIALGSSILGLIAALFTAYSLTRLPERARDRLLTLSNMTSNFAGVPLAFAYIILLGNNGVFTLLLKSWGLDVLTINLYSWTGLVLVYVYFQVPLATLLLYPVYYGVQERWREAASLLGAGSFAYWRRIALPILAPGIAGTFVILFANAMGAYATAYALVGSNFNLLAVRIGALVSGDVITRPQLGSALAVLLGLIMLIAMSLSQWFMRRVRKDLA